MPDGKPKYISITASSKSEVMEKAAVYDFRGEDITVSEMVQRYINERSAVLSPSTIRGYVSIYNASIRDNVFGSWRVQIVTDSHAQRWISELSGAKSAKSVKNAYFLFCAALKHYFPRKDIVVRLPRSKQPRLHTPTTAEVNAIVQLAEQNRELYKAILLGAVGMMRRGEIAALTAEDCDFSRNTIRIDKAQVRLPEGGYITRPPKTDASNRTIILPQFVMDLLPKQGKTVDLTIAQITNQFIDLVKRSGLPHFRFHDLRHYAASIAASSSVGASVEAIKARGGWATDGMMKRIYINQLGDEVDKDTLAINGYFEQKIRANSVPSLCQLN